MALKNPLQAGVTLIEMIVVVAIIAAVSSVIIFNYSDFSTNVSVRNLAQEVALSIRKAQTYATSARPIEGLSGVDSQTFPGYGISFAVDGPLTPPDPMTPGPKQFVLFAQTGSNGQNLYEKGTQCGNPAPDDECLESFTITTADKISSICAVVVSGSRPACFTDDADVAITFERPSPDAVICMRSNTAEYLCDIPYVTLNLESAKGLKRSVTVWSTGQISVQ